VNITNYSDPNYKPVYTILLLSLS